MGGDLLHEVLGEEQLVLLAVGHVVVEERDQGLRCGEHERPVDVVARAQVVVELRGGVGLVLLHQELLEGLEVYRPVLVVGGGLALVKLVVHEVDVVSVEPQAELHRVAQHVVRHEALEHALLPGIAVPRLELRGGVLDAHDAAAVAQHLRHMAGGGDELALPHHGVPVELPERLAQLLGHQEGPAGLARLVEVDPGLVGGARYAGAGVLGAHLEHAARLRRHLAQGVELGAGHLGHYGEGLVCLGDRLAHRLGELGLLELGVAAQPVVLRQLHELVAREFRQVLGEGGAHRPLGGALLYDRQPVVAQLRVAGPAHRLSQGLAQRLLALIADKPRKRPLVRGSLQLLLCHSCSFCSCGTAAFLAVLILHNLGCTMRSTRAKGARSCCERKQEMSSKAAMKREMAGARARIDQNASAQLLLGLAGLRLTCAR